MATLWTNAIKHSADITNINIDFLTGEDGNFLLQENGGKLQLEINTDMSLSWTGEIKHSANWTNQTKN